MKSLSSIIFLIVPAFLSAADPSTLYKQFTSQTMKEFSDAGWESRVIREMKDLDYKSQKKLAEKFADGLKSTDETVQYLCEVGLHLLNIFPERVVPYMMDDQLRFSGGSYSIKTWDDVDRAVVTISRKLVAQDYDNAMMKEVIALGVAGPRAASAIPEIIRYMKKNADNEEFITIDSAADALVSIGPASVLFLNETAQCSDIYVCGAAMDREKFKESFEQYFNKDHAVGEIRYYSAQALANIKARE